MFIRKKNPFDTFIFASLFLPKDTQYANLNTVLPCKFKNSGWKNKFPSPALFTWAAFLIQEGSGSFHSLRHLWALFEFKHISEPYMGKFTFLPSAR